MDNEKPKVTKEHLVLLKELEWEYVNCEYGAPAVDCKRPYGNSDVELDIIELLGWEDSIENRKNAQSLHLELLNIIEYMCKNANKLFNI